MCLTCIILPLRPGGLTMLFLCPQHYSLFWALLQSGSDYGVSALSFPWQGIFLTPDKISHLLCSPTDSCTYLSWHESQIFACSSFLYTFLCCSQLNPEHPAQRLVPEIFYALLPTKHLMNEWQNEHMFINSFHKHHRASWHSFLVFTVDVIHDGFARCFAKIDLCT